MSNLVKLGSLTNIRTGKLDANKSSENGQYPFFTCSRETLRIDSYSYDCECVLVAGNGDLNVKYYEGKFDAYQRTYIIEVVDKTKLLVKYLYYFLDVYVEVLRAQAIGGVIKYIKLGYLTDALLPLPSIEKQEEIIQLFEKCDSIIELRQEQLRALEELVKLRFLEIFGDMKTNPFGWEQSTIGECCTLKSGTTLPIEVENEGGPIPYVKVGDMNYPGNERYIVTSSRYVSEATAEKKLFEVGSVLFPKRGGAISTNKKRMTKLPVCADLNVMGVSSNGKLLPEYLLAYFDMIDLGALADGSSVPQINNKNIAPLVISIPPMEEQEKFSTFIEQSDNLKFVVQKSIDKTQLLFDSLMQKYFS